MADFDDLLDPPIPREVGLELLEEFRKVAVSDLFVHRAVANAASRAPVSRILESAGSNMRGALSAASRGNEAVARKRLVAKNTLLGKALEQGATARAPAMPAVKAASMQKEAVTPSWVVGTARRAVSSAPPGRLEQAASSSMKSVLDLAKRKTPEAAQSAEKRMLLRNVALGARNKLSANEDPAPFLQRPMGRALTGAVAGGTTGNMIGLSREIFHGGSHALPNAAYGALTGALIGGVGGLIEDRERRRKEEQKQHRKSAADKVALSPGFIGRAAHGASADRLTGARNAAVNAAHRLATGGSLNQAKARAYRGYHKLVNAAEDEITRRSKSASEVAVLQQDPSPEQVMLSEQQALLHQTAAENEVLQAQVQQTGDMAAQHAMAAEQAGAVAAQTQQQLAEAQQAAQMVQAQAQQAAVQAQMQQQSMAQELQLAQANAANEANAKMRLGIRIQQMRQQLATLAAQDPAGEEGVSAPAIATPDQAAAQEQQAAVEQGGAAQPSQAAAQQPAQQQQPAASPKTAAFSSGLGIRSKMVGALRKARDAVTEHLAQGHPRASNATQQAGEHFRSRAASGNPASRRVLALPASTESGRRAEQLRSRAAGSTQSSGHVTPLPASSDSTRRTELLERALKADNPAARQAREFAATAPHPTKPTPSATPVSAASKPSTTHVEAPPHSPPAAAAAESTAAPAAAAASAPSAGSHKLPLLVGGTMGGTALLGGALGARNRRREAQRKVATDVASERDVRNRARLATAATHAIPAAAAAALLGTIGGHLSHTPPSIGTQALHAAGGALAGGVHGALKFDRDEMKSDLSAIRALKKEQLGRRIKEMEKAPEKTASLELSDSDIDRLYGLV